MPQSPSIHQLSPDVIHCIAAGEVVERPGVIVKELIENALDAGASQIMIELRRSGLDAIVVTDNGWGMDETDLLLSFQRHTTSKIRTSEDLQRLSTFGFRGEALASIASASQMTLRSRIHDSSVGTQLVIKNGQLQEKAPVGMPAGTVVEVTHLFSNLPARKKFLKQPTTELKYISEVVTAAALTNPQVAFSLKNDHKILLSTPPHQSPPERVVTLFGEAISTQLRPLQSEHSPFLVHGFISTPQLSFRSKTKQYLFVNRRPVSYPKIHKIVKESYGSFLTARAEPVFILELKLPPNTIDVNIHPRKEQVNFLDEKQILQMITETVTQTLNQTDLSFQYQPHVTEPWSVHDSQSSGSSTSTSSVLRELVQPWYFNEQPLTDILQANETYLITTGNDGLILLDQHAAHERILYEQFSAALHSAAATLPLTQLDPPILFTPSPTEEIILEEQQEILAQLGFKLEQFGNQTYKITELPQIMADRNVSTLLHELLADLAGDQPISGLDTAAQRTLAYLACRNAVKAGDPLTPSQRQELLRKLDETSNRFTCPHGRPTMIKISWADLEKAFGRRK